VQELLLEVLGWLPPSSKLWLYATVLPLCIVASRVYLAEGQGSAVTDIGEHDAIVTSALQRIIATFQARPRDAEGDKLVWAAAVDAACRSLDNYSTPPLPACPDRAVTGWLAGWP
jgi:hypothetical protein